jgi:hypothetical protein
VEKISQGAHPTLDKGVLPMKNIKVADAPAEWIKKFVLAGVQLSPDGTFEVKSEADGLPAIAPDAPLIKQADPKIQAAVCLIYYKGVGFVCYVP